MVIGHLVIALLIVKYKMVFLTSDNGGNTYCRDIAAASVILDVLLIGTAASQLKF